MRDKKRVLLLSAKRLIVSGIAIIITRMVFAVEPMVTAVSAKQRYPWNGKVDITYEVVGDVTAGFPSWNQPFLSVMARNLMDGSCYEASWDTLSGDKGTAEGTHHVVWDMSMQGLVLNSDKVVFTVVYATPLYCVIDLSGGTNASTYPVSYLAGVPSGGWTDEYKTTKLVLRLIEPGAIPTHDATITKPFYCGIFEITQKQYELVTGSNPSQYKGDTRPVEKVSWNMIRGDSSDYNWPSFTHVDPNSFIGMIQVRSGLSFDLPTEAQWEYACRAGTASKYNNGGDTADDLKQLGRHYYNKSDGKGGYSEHTTVGSYQPNAWGIYDMHGNIDEWCLDWWGNSLSGNDPVGSFSGTGRVVRGGGWNSDTSSCTSSTRWRGSPSYSAGHGPGFRLVRTLPNQ